MEQTAVPVYRGSIAKLGLDSREDFGVTVMGAAMVYLVSKSLISYALRDLIAAALAALCWKFLFIPAMQYYRKTFPPKYPLHWLRSRVLLAPVLHCRPDSDPQPGVLPDPPNPA